MYESDLLSLSFPICEVVNVTTVPSKAVVEISRDDACKHSARSLSWKHGSLTLSVAMVCTQALLPMTPGLRNAAKGTQAAKSSQRDHWDQFS